MNLLSVSRNLSSRNLQIENLSEQNDSKDLAACNRCWENLFSGYSLPHLGIYLIHLLAGSCFMIVIIMFGKSKLLQKKVKNCG